MKSSFHCECKFCNHSFDFESEWVPVEVLQARANKKITFHALKHHPEAFEDKKRVRYVIHQFFWSDVIIILYALLTFLRIIFYPLWWVLDKLYD